MLQTTRQATLGNRLSSLALSVGVASRDVETEGVTRSGRRAPAWARLAMVAIMAGVVGVGGVTAWAEANKIELSAAEKARQERNNKNDVHNLRQRDSFVTLQTDAFLKTPETSVAGEFTVARVAPKVKFQVLPHLVPEHFSEDAYQAGWANWAKVTRSEDNRFYLAASDHLGRRARINLYEYRPADGVVERVLDVSEALGWSRDMWTDGKLHGRMGIMPDGTLWAATHRGPEPTEQWYREGYRGSWLLSYNIHTGEAKNHGVPLIGQELPVHTLDPKRGIFMATGGLNSTVLSYDVKAGRTRYAGSPPNGWVWHSRSVFLDPDTGLFWGMDASEKPYRFMSFDPELNRFKRYDVNVPEHPVSGGQAILRGHTTKPAIDGWHYWSTSNGTMFRFKPDAEAGPKVETVGVNWDRGRDVLQMALCPAGRYIYYQPKGYPSPLVQYDVKTGKRKAIGFLQDHIFETYGYWSGSEVYGLEVSNDGSFVVIVENGTFDGRGRAFGHPALTVVEIPESERPLD